jgi:uncharacterized protein
LRNVRPAFGFLKFGWCGKFWKGRDMLKVEDMPLEEMRALPRRVGYGHLGCAREGRPYVVPMHYPYDGECLYLFTTEGTKTSFIEANAEVCMQVEEVKSISSWQSVMVTGRAGRIINQEEREHAMQLITDNNPNRIRPAIIDGRQTV